MNNDPFDPKDEFDDIDDGDVVIGLVIIAFLAAVFVATFVFAPELEALLRRAFA